MIDTPQRALAVTALLTAVFVTSALTLGDVGGENLTRDLILLALNTVPLLLLHRNPLLVVVVLAVAYPLWLEADHPSHLFQSLPTLAALYATGGWSRPLWLRAVALASPVWMMAAVLSGYWQDTDAFEIAYVAVIFGLAWALGVVVAARRSYAEQLEAKTVALEAARRELAERAVADERARIARELHDVIAHAMSVITIRAGVGAHLVETRPAEAAVALGVIEHTGREALGEMRRMLAVLRDPDPRAPRGEPQPGLTNLPRLVEQVAEAGVVVTVTVTGTPRALPPGLDLAAYRVVQEALTNVVKHAPGARAEVTVRYAAEILAIEVRNAGPVVTGVEPGQGLRGMSERVALYDGRFEAGPEPDGFRVSARFPLPAAVGE